MFEVHPIPIIPINEAKYLYYPKFLYFGFNYNVLWHGLSTVEKQLKCKKEKAQHNSED